MSDTHQDQITTAKVHIYDNFDDTNLHEHDHETHSLRFTTICSRRHLACFSGDSSDLSLIFHLPRPFIRQWLVGWVSWGMAWREAGLVFDCSDLRGGRKGTLLFANMMGSDKKGTNDETMEGTVFRQEAKVCTRWGLSYGCSKKGLGTHRGQSENVPECHLL